MSQENRKLQIGDEVITDFGRVAVHRQAIQTCATALTSGQGRPGGAKPARMTGCTTQTATAPPGAARTPQRVGRIYAASADRTTPAGQAGGARRSNSANK